MTNTQNRAGFKPECALVATPLVLLPTRLGDRLRANAELLELAIKSRRCGPRVLRALVHDLLDHAGEADGLVEARAWLASAARGQPVVRRAAA